VYCLNNARIDQVILASSWARILASIPPTGAAYTEAD
jgi:hypothetical protein